MTTPSADDTLFAVLHLLAVLWALGTLLWTQPQRISVALEAWGIFLRDVWERWHSPRQR